MKLKCIGGPCDGRVIEVADSTKLGDLVAVAHYARPPVLFDANIEAALNTPVTMEQVHYTPRAVMHSRKADPNSLDSAERAAALCGHNVSDVTVRYLAPVDWSDVRAIQHQFTK